MTYTNPNSKTVKGRESSLLRERIFIIFFSALFALSTFDNPAVQTLNSRFSAPVFLVFLKSYGKEAMFILIGVFTTTIFLKIRSNHLYRSSYAILALFMIQFILSVKHILINNIDRSVKIAVFAATVFILFFVLIPTIKGWKNVGYRHITLSGLLGNMVICAGNFYFVVQNSAYGYNFNDRLFGLSANPNPLGYSLAITTPFVLAFITRPQKLWVRGLTLLLFSLNGWIIIETGSRGALGIYFLNVGLVLTGLWRVRVLILIYLVSALLGFLFIIYIGVPGDPVDFLEERGVNRMGVWSRQMEDFISAPVFGVIEQGSRVSFGENAWLGIASRLGVVGLLLLVSFVVFAKPALGHGKNWAKDDVRFLQFAKMSYGSIVVASIFQGLIVGFVNTAIWLLVVFACVKERKVFGG